ncbi:hypothetical protein SEPL_014 [Salmonella phage SE_PL]|uniref:hypothetical protein n=1 Tax=Salmonella enterica TaxID=28901 RepID=UPI000FDF921A|nr:hypothetical protein CPT_Munch_414 [Salmonella phage Munch]EAZ2022700.1 hypothetical protein [Salmonella enterica]ECV9083834.1 hypothetical protein [Salmonella enterica subsp. enterica serovar Infantis]MCP0435572.1 hypothetical protein [Salmonella enterica subsp. enterica serovar Mbandaka]QCW19118.1 hypothetical protein 7t3_0601 [Salmonella phage 7t3]QIG62627.1 hypothetical protein SEPL_014 [Salmonella phage SE_PL]
MKAQILFSINDVTGQNNNVNKNIINHFYKNSAGIEMRTKVVVKDNVIKRLRPRGKAYFNMWITQVDKHGL